MKQAVGKQTGTGGSREHVILDARIVEQVVRGCIRMLLSAVLAGAQVLDGRAPFGVAMTAASGGGIAGGGAVLGACLGSLCQLEMTHALRYTSAALLCYAAAFALYDIKKLRRPWTMPVIAGVSVLFTGIASHTRSSWTTEEQVAFVLEVLMSVGAVWAFRAAVRVPERLSRREELPADQRGGLLILLGVLLVALEPLSWSGISLGRCLGGSCVLWAARIGGSATGAVWGSVLGVGMDLAGGGQAFRAMVWPLGAMAVGGCGKGGKLRCVLLWWATVCAAAVWVRDWDSALLCVGEGVLSGILYLCLPRDLIARGERLVARGVGGMKDPGGVGMVRQRLQETAQAYRTLCHALKESIRPPENDGDISMVFDRAASRVCRSCTNQKLCWQRDYSGTFSALNDATAAMVERGKAVSGDFSLYFSSRCVKMNDFLEAVNEELTALFYRRQYRARIRDSRESVCRQYGQLSDLLWETARELDETLLPEPEHRRALSRYMGRRGIRGEVRVFRDRRGLLRVWLEGEECEGLTAAKELEQISGILGRLMRLERSGDGGISLVEQEPYKAVAGVASRKKDGETVSGDAGTYFKRFDGRVYLLLCDGMGSGVQAGQESALAIRLLEQFLLTGIPAEQALLTLASALALRGEETGGFTTVDLLEIDLFTGEAALYKLGSAPTYVHQGDSIRRLAGGSLPAGLAEGSRESVDRFTLRLSPGDCVLMVSDGICGSGEDGWIMEQLRSFDGDSPRRLAARLVSRSPQGATDDRTALVVKFEKRT